MDLGFFKNLENSLKNTEVKEFINELSDYLDNLKEKVNNKLSNQEQEESRDLKLNEPNDKLKEFREENCLYQVVDRGRKGIYLQNINNNVVFEETDIPQEIKDKIGNDYILRYKNGTYIFEEELTDKFFEGLIDINDYKKN